MSKELKDGQLKKFIQSNQKRLICVDFGNPDCPPCRAIKPFWDSLVTKYPTCDFYSITCNDNPGDSQENKIKATPTFVFFLKGQEVHRIQGANKNEIISTIEKFKPAGDFSGSGRSIVGGNPVDGNDFFANLKVTKEAPKPSPKIPPTFDVPKPSPKLPPKVVQRVEDPETRDTLRAMGFEDATIDAVFKATNFGSVDDCINYIEQNQRTDNLKINTESPEIVEQPVTENQEPPKPVVEVPKEPVSIEPVPIDPIKLSPAGESLKQDLLDMGFEEAIVLRGIDYCGDESIDQVMDYINQVQNGNEPPPKKKKVQLTQEQIDEKAKQLRELAKAKHQQEEATPESLAQAEIRRRKETQETNEQREKYEQIKREQELMKAQKEKMEARMALEKARQRIAQQRAEQKGETIAKPVELKPEVPKKNPTECTLQILFPNGSRSILKFGINDSLLTVQAKLIEQDPSLRTKSIAFETTIPKAPIPPNRFGETLMNLGLCPRSQLVVKY